MPMSDQPVPGFPCAARTGILIRAGLRQGVFGSYGLFVAQRISIGNGLRRRFSPRFTRLVADARIEALFHIPESHQGKPGNTAYSLAVDHGRDCHMKGCVCPQNVPFYLRSHSAKSVPVVISLAMEIGGRSFRWIAVVISFNSSIRPWSIPSSAACMAAMGSRPNQRALLSDL